MPGSPLCRPRTIDGWVVYRDDGGFGIEFQSMDQRDFEAFKEFILRQAENPEPLHREVEEGRIPELKDWVIT